AERAQERRHERVAEDRVVVARVPAEERPFVDRAAEEVGRRPGHCDDDRKRDDIERKQPDPRRNQEPVPESLAHLRLAPRGQALIFAQAVSHSWRPEPVCGRKCFPCRTSSNVTCSHGYFFTRLEYVARPVLV